MKRLSTHENEKKGLSIPNGWISGWARSRGQGLIVEAEAKQEKGKR